MARAFPPIIDADGHVFEDTAAIFELMGEPYRNERRGVIGASPWPRGDHLHVPVGPLPDGAFDTSVKAPQWRQFAADLGIEAAVLYPSLGLSQGRIANPHWAEVTARAYNDWLVRDYCALDPALKGMAILPMQDPQAAAVELRRAVGELGMLGAVMPPAGLRNYLGDVENWPVLEVANALGCPLAVHGGPFANIGLDHMRSLAPTHALGHPFSMMTNFASMVFNDVFERFPNVRFGFLEAGVSWLVLCLERFGGSSAAFAEWGGSRQQVRGGRLTDALIGLLRGGRIFVGVEGDEFSLASVIALVGAEPFMFSSDYPHEVNTEICRHEIEELIENDGIAPAAKEAILYHNAARFYGL